MARDDVGQLTIRSYRRSDYEQVIALWEAVGFRPAPEGDSEDALAYKVARDRGPFLIAETGGRVVGTAMASWDGRYAWVARVAVAPDMRRRGIGRSLMAEVEGQLTALGAHRCLLNTAADNQAAKSFYESHGYQVVDGLVTMCKLLSASKQERCGS